MIRKKLILKETKKIAIVYRPNTPAATVAAKKLSAWLIEKKYKVFTAPKQKQIPGTKLMKSQESFEQTSLVISLGGDGTYLRSIRLLQGIIVPILGVNLGSLGFLTPTKAEDLFTAVEQTLKNKMELCPRSMISAQVIRKDKVTHELVALNDIVIERGPQSQLINLEIFCDQSLVSNVLADGIIIASPTGSTAYTLSAGGPIVHPDTKAFVVTSVAPHSLTNRPLIFPDSTTLTFQLNNNTKPAHIIVDGVKMDILKAGDHILIKRFKQDHLMVCEPNQNYFNLLREKLKFGQRS